MDSSDGLRIGDRTYARFREVHVPQTQFKVSLGLALFLLWWFLSSILLVWWARRLSDTGDVRGVQILGLVFAGLSLILPLCGAIILARRDRGRGSEVPANLPMPSNRDAILSLVLIRLNNEDLAMERGWLSVEHDELRFQGRRCSFHLTSEELNRVKRSGASLTLVLAKHSPIPRQSVVVWAYEIREGRITFTSGGAEQLLKQITALSPSSKASLLPPINLPWPTEVDRSKVLFFGGLGLLSGFGLGFIAWLSILLAKSVEPRNSGLVLIAFALSGCLLGAVFATEHPIKARTRNKQIEKWQRQAKKT